MPDGLRSHGLPRPKTLAVMRQVKPNVVVFNSAISACQKGNSEGNCLCKHC